MLNNDYADYDIMHVTLKPDVCKNMVSYISKLVTVATKQISVTFRHKQTKITSIKYCYNKKVFICVVDEIVHITK